MIDLTAPVQVLKKPEISKHILLKGTPTKILKEMDSDALRERYWHLWRINHPHFGLPVRWRAELDKSPGARYAHRVRQRELIRIEKIVVVQRGESLKLGVKYNSLFGNGDQTQTPIQIQPA